MVSLLGRICRRLDFSSFAVSLLIWGSMAIVWGTVFIPWASWQTWFGCFWIALFSLLSLATVITYYRAMVLEPGKVPEGWRPAHMIGMSDAELAPKIEEYKTQTSQERAKKKYLELVEPEFRYCTHCEAFKPERTHHCRECKRCVLQMDHHCLAMDHEVLTNKGFASLQQFQQDNSLLVASYNRSTKKIQYERPSRVVVNHDASPMIRVCAPEHGVDLLVTEGHQMWLKDADSDSGDQCTASEMAFSRSGRVRLVAAALNGTSDGLEQHVARGRDEQSLLELIGAWIRVGDSAHFAVPRSSRQCDWILERLQLLKCDWKLHADGVVVAVDSADERLRGLFASQKSFVLESFVAGLSTEQTRWLVNGLSFGGMEEQCVVTDSAAVRDALVLVLIRSGMSATFDVNERALWRVSFSATEHLEVDIGTHVSACEEYRGPTWCVTVPQGLIFTRRAVRSNDGATVLKASTPVVVGNCPWVSNCVGANNRKDLFSFYSMQLCRSLVRWGC